MLELDKVVKLELTSPSGEVILSAESERLSTPKMFAKEASANNIIIIKGKELPPFTLSHNVYIIAYMKNGDRVRYAGAVRMSLPHQVNVQLHSDLGTIMPERRRYFKVDADLMCNINAYAREGEEYEYNVPLLATIRNISIGGIFLMCTDQKFSPDDTLLVNFKIDGEPVEVMAKVLRAQKGSDGKLEGYGCQFVNTDKSQEERFAQLVYKIQLQKRSEKMEREERRLDARRR